LQQLKKLEPVEVQGCDLLSFFDLLIFATAFEIDELDLGLL